VREGAPVANAVRVENVSGANGVHVGCKLRTNAYRNIGLIMAIRYTLAMYPARGEEVTNS